MANKKELTYAVNGFVDSDFYKSLQKVQNRLAQAKNAMTGFNSMQAQSAAAGRKATGGIRGLTKSVFLANIATQALTSGMSMLWSAGAGALNLAGQMEQANMGFTVMLGSASKAKVLLKDIQVFAAQTPFEFPEIQSAARSLLAFGIASGEIKGKLGMLGDIASGINQPIGELAEIYGKIRVSGRVFAEDMNQLQGRGIPITAALAKQFGVAESSIRGMVEKGKVGFPEIDKAMRSLTVKGGKFYKMMNMQSTTWVGLLSTVKDTLNQAGVGIMDRLMPRLKSAARWLIANQKQITSVASKAGDELKAVLDRVISIGNFIRNNWGWIKPTVIGITAAFTAWKLVIGTITALEWALNAPLAAQKTLLNGLAVKTAIVTQVTKAWTAAQWLLNAAMDANPIGVVILAVAALVAVLALTKKYWNEITAAIKAAADAANKFFGLDKKKYVPLPKLQHPGTFTGAFGAGGGMRANGGPVLRGSQYLVGEKGPELFTPSRSGGIIPNHALGAGGGITVNFTINAPGGSASEVQRGINSSLDVLKAQLRRIARDEGRTSFND